MSLKRWFMLAILLPVGCALAVAALPLFFVAGRHVAQAAPDCVSGPAGLAAYYFDGSKGTLNLSDGRTWVITLTGIDGSAVTGNKTYHLLVQDHGTGSGWETLPTQTHHDFYGAGGHLLQSDDNGWTVRSSHGFNPGDVLGTYDLRVVMTQRTDDKWDISPYFRLPGGNWTLFYDGAWTTATAFDLTKTRVAVGIDAGGGGTLCFTAPTANAVDLTNAFVDDDWVGLPNGTEVFFPGDPNPHFIGLDAFATIQDGISNVQGSTVNVAAGTYTETGQIVISKNLSIVGAGASTTIIKPAGDTGSSGDARGWFFVNSGVTFNLSGVTLDGTGRNIYQGIRHKGAGTISNCVFSNIKYPGYQGTAIAVMGPAGMNVDVTNCTFTEMGRIGVIYYGPGVTGTFSGNTYTGKGSGDWLDYGVEVGAGAHAIVTRNTISGNTGVASVDGSISAGVLLTTFYGAGTQATITENFISGSTIGVNVGRGADTSVATVFNNSLMGNTKGVKSTAPLVDASGNWWGTQTPADVAGQVSTNVDYTPWLDSGTDKDPGTPGFQGDFSTLNVDDDSPQSGATGRVQEGVNLVSASTVNVAAGTYTEQVDIGKPLTLTGAGQAITIIKSPAALATKFVTGANNNKPVVYIHDAASVTVQQLTVDGDGKGNGNYRMEGIAFYNAGGTVDHVTITRVRETPLSGAQHGGALIAYNTDGLPRTLNVSSNIISEYQKNGMALMGAGLTTTVTGNTVTGWGPTGVIAQNGIQVSDGASGTVGGNTVSNNSYTGPDDAASNVLVFSADTDVTGNSLTDGQVGLYYVEGSGTVDGNTVSATTAGVGRPDYWGIVVSDPPAASPSPFEDEAAPPAGGFSAAPMGAGVMTVVVNGNTLTGDGSADSVGLEADAGYYGPENVSFTASGNTISNWGTGVMVAQCTEGCDTGVFVSVDVGPDNNISAPIADPSNSGLHAMGAVNLNVHNNTFTGGYDAVKLRLAVTGTVNDNVVSGYAKNGITAGKAADDNTGTNMTISGNTVTGGGPGQVNAQNGIQVGPNAVARIEDNTVSNHVYTLGTAACAGPGTKGDAAYYDACYTAAGVMVYQGSATVTGNIITGNQIGVDDSGAQTHYNIIRDNIIFGVNNVSAGVANAENNWWGSCSGPYHPTLNPFSTGDAVSDNVGFTPWISGPCDADADGLTDDQEKLIFFTDPNNPDTDNDGFFDDGVDVDGPGPKQPNDNCPNIANPGQENADNQIGNGIGIPGHDSTVPNSAGDNIGDACESPDADNDGIANASDTDPGGDVTYDDNNNGIMCPADTADDGPSWDHNCNGILDGKDLVPGSCPLAVNPNGDDDGDGLRNTWEVCKWGTNPAVLDSDGDALGDCQEAADVDGNGVVNFTGDVIYYAKAALLAPAAFGRDGDFDIDGNNVINFTGDVIQEAKFGLLPGLCK